MHGSAVSCDGGIYPSIFIRLDDKEIWTWIRQKVFPSLPLEIVPPLGRQIEQGDREHLPPIHLYLIFKKSSWKNQVRRIGFLVYFQLDFYCLCSLQKSISKSMLQAKNPVCRT